MNNDWKQEKNFCEGVAKARKAKELLEEAETLEKEAKELLKEVRDARYEFLSNLYRRKQEELRVLMEEKEDQNKKKEKYRKSICEKTGHIYALKERKKLDYSYQGIKYPVKETRECRICGEKNTKIVDEAIVYSSFQSLESTPNITEEYKKMMAKVENEIDSKISTLYNELEQIQISLNELCKFFGHDITNMPYEYMGSLQYCKCKCCGREISGKEYRDDYYRVPYRILP